MREKVLAHRLWLNVLKQKALRSKVEFEVKDKAIQRIRGFTGNFSPEQVVETILTREFSYSVLNKTASSIGEKCKQLTLQIEETQKNIENLTFSRQNPSQTIEDLQQRKLSASAHLKSNKKTLHKLHLKRLLIDQWFTVFELKLGIQPGLSLFAPRFSHIMAQIRGLMQPLNGGQPKKERIS